MITKLTTDDKIFHDYLINISINCELKFITFIHDLDNVWKDLARSHGIPIDEDTNAKIIMDDIIGWARQIEYALAYMQC